MLFMIFGTLLPMLNHLQQSLHAKKERLSAIETLHEAALEIKSYGSRDGVRVAGNILFRWEMAEQLCVYYEDYRDVQKLECLE